MSELLETALDVLDVREPHKTPLAAAELIQRGLHWNAYVAVTTALPLPAEEVKVVLAIPERTLARRRRTKRFTPEESERMLRIARVIAQGTEVLGSKAATASWLQTGNRALGGKRPLELLNTSVGAEMVSSVLTRLAYGVYS